MATFSKKGKSQFSSFFPELDQGEAYLRKQWRMKHKHSGMNSIFPWSKHKPSGIPPDYDPPTSSSCYAAPGQPRYGWCPNAISGSPTGSPSPSPAAAPPSASPPSASPPSDSQHSATFPLAFIDSYSPYDSNGQLKKCLNINQGKKNKWVPCACNNAMCTEATPYCNYKIGSCFQLSTEQQKAEEDWAVDSNCPGNGRFSNCKYKDGCANYGYCPPVLNTLEWQKDMGPHSVDALNSQRNSFQAKYDNYLGDVKQWVKVPPGPPPCHGDPKHCIAKPPYYGRNVTIRQEKGAAPYGPGYPAPGCGLEVLKIEGVHSGSQALTKAHIQKMDDTCHRSKECIGFGQKKKGSWDFLKWNSNPSYSGLTDKRMKTPGDYPKFFYIQKSKNGCNSTKCCGIKGTADNCKYDDFSPSCYSPLHAPPAPPTPAPPPPPPPPPPIAGGWGSWSPSPCPARGVQIRECDSPPPLYRGSACIGLNGNPATSEARKCNPANS